MRRFCAFILILFFSLSITGCGIDTRRELKFSSWGSQTEVLILKSLLTEFERENPDIRVEFMHAPSGYFSKLHLYFAAKMEPDVIFINNIAFPKYYEEGLFEDISPYFKDELANGVFFEKAVENFKREGRLYAVPRDISNIVIFYNKTLLQKNGIKEPKEDWSLDELYDIAQKLTADTDNDGKTDVWGINRNEKMISWLPFVTTNGGAVLDSSGKLTVTDKNFVNALQRYSDLVTKDKIAPPKSALSGKTYPQMFMLGELGLLTGGRWNVPQFSLIKAFEWDVINFPTNGKALCPADSSGWAIAKRSKNKADAIKLVKFLSSQKSIEEFTKTGLITPARKDIANSELFLNLPKNKNNKAFLYAAEHSRIQNVNKNITEIEDILYAELEPAFNGKLSVGEVLQGKMLTDKLCSLSKCN